MNGSEHPRAFGSAVRRSLTGVKRKHHDRASMCASYLDRSGFFERETRIYGMAATQQDKEESLKAAARSAFTECQTEGLIPSGLLASLIWKMILMPFFERLIEELIAG